MFTAVVAAKPKRAVLMLRVTAATVPRVMESLLRLHIMRAVAVAVEVVAILSAVTVAAVPLVRVMPEAVSPTLVVAGAAVIHQPFQQRAQRVLF
tara:strand:+ start:424 stop:705 length:282 start_codon:yes stop_codon:yes gene_type:complete